MDWQYECKTALQHLKDLLETTKRFTFTMTDAELREWHDADSYVKVTQETISAYGDDDEEEEDG